MASFRGVVPLARSADDGHGLRSPLVVVVAGQRLVIPVQVTLQGVPLDGGDKHHRPCPVPGIAREGDVAHVAGDVRRADEDLLRVRALDDTLDQDDVHHGLVQRKFRGEVEVSA
ncbi:hypothetical protein HPB48_006317 [Haemaphysalis longicornis]|uniref:Uncharacterized protein n=1 Tax=Haemaphysalis longicornis TaxID=44386 RepID=A0A9J6FXE5_HAELO|nr:hypothetical protein HPB48_006317 [Haemaphysalis longicornis]